MCSLQIRNKKLTKFKGCTPWYGYYLRALSIARQLNINTIKGHEDLELDFDQLFYSRDICSLPMHQIEFLSPKIPDKLDNTCVTVYMALNDHIENEARLRFIPQTVQSRCLRIHKSTEKNIDLDFLWN
eukprot:UN34089